MSKKSIFSVFVFPVPFPVSQLRKIVQTWKSKLILFCYFRNFFNLQGWGVDFHFPCPLHRNFIRLLWICFPVSLTLGYICWLVVDLWLSLSLTLENIIAQKAEKRKIFHFQVFQVRYEWLLNCGVSFRKLLTFSRGIF